MHTKFELILSFGVGEAIGSGRDVPGASLIAAIVHFKKLVAGLGCNSVVEHLPSMHKDLG
jgi:hypothetical protein